MGAGKGEQRKVARPLDGNRQLTLVGSTVAGDPAWDDLPSLGDEKAKRPGILVVDHLLVGTEPTDLAALEGAPFTGATASLGSSFFTHGILLRSLFG